MKYYSICDPRGTTSTCVKKLGKSTRLFRGRDYFPPVKDSYEVRLKCR